MSERPVLLLPGATSAEAAVEYFGDIYECASWCDGDLDDDPKPYSNGALSGYAGRKVTVWGAPRNKVSANTVISELLRLQCKVRFIDLATTSLEPSGAKISGFERAKLYDYARQQAYDVTVDPMAPAPYEPDQPDEWGHALDLWEDRPVPRLDPAILPGPLADFAKEQSELTGVDPTVIGISCLVACAGAINDGFRIQPKAHETGWTESARLWGAIVGDPSSKKSPGIDKAIGPLKRIDHRLGLAHKDVRREYEEERQAWERKKGDKGPPPTRPPEPRLLVSDTTIEALSDVMADNPQGIMVYRDELAGWFGSMDAYGAKGSSKDRSFWLEAYNGGSKRIDRVTRGHIYVENCSVCLLGGIQPAVFAAKMRNVEEDGLLQRFMVVVATAAVADQDRPADEGVIEAYTQLIEDLFKLRPAFGMEVYKLSPEAQVIRRTFMDTVKGLISHRAVPHSMIAYLGKWEGLFARLLLTYHMINYVGNGAKTRPIVDDDTAMRVCQLMEQCLLPHALEFYGNVLSGNEAVRHAQWIAGYILSRDLTELATRDITQGYREYYRLEGAKQLLVWSMLENAGWLRPIGRVNRTTRIATRWEVNPVVHQVYADQAKRERIQREATKKLIEETVARTRGDKDERP